MVKKLQAKLAKAKAKKGFTLVELIVVIAIIAVLAAILIPTLTAQIQKSQVTSCDTTASKLVEELNNWVGEYVTNGGGYYTKSDNGGKCVTIEITGGEATVTMPSDWTIDTTNIVGVKMDSFADTLANDMTWKSTGSAEIYLDKGGKAYAAWYTESPTAPSAKGFTRSDAGAVTPSFSWKDAKHPGVDGGTGTIVGTSPKVGGTGTTMQ